MTLHIGNVRLREGRATIEVGFAGYSTSIAVAVNQFAPLLIDR